MKNVIIIGASSGIGAELAKIYAQQGAKLGLTARRSERLEQLQQSLACEVFIKTMDITECEKARADLTALIDEMGGVDVIILSSGHGIFKRGWQNEQDTISVNVMGFVALASLAYDYFEQKGGGQFVGLSSVACLRGDRKLTAYGASKAFISNYMEGLRHRAINKKLPITISDIRPGYVATEMTAQNRGMFWVSSAERASAQIYQAIEQKTKVAYITRRWRIMAWLMKYTPDWLYFR